MPFGKGRRKLLWAFGFLFAGVAAVWFSLPVWFPWVLRPLASRAGARFAAYERLGYSRFVLHNFALTNSSVVFHARRFEAFVPSVWLWKLALHQQTESKPYASFSDWNCQLMPSGNKNPSPPFSQIQDLAATSRVLERWIPTATLEHGAVHSGETTLAVPEANWKEGHLQAGLQLPAQASGRLLQASLSPAHPFQLQVSCPDLALDSMIDFSTNKAGLDLDTSINLQSNRLSLQAHFGPSDILPQTALLRGSNLQFSAETAQLPQYGELGGSLLAQWEHGQFSLDLTATARPATGQSNLPPVDVDLGVRGDTNSASVERLVVKTPFLGANLSNPVRLGFTAPYLADGANLNLAADLSRQQWAPLTGKLTGFARLGLGNNNLPQAQLQIAGTNIGNESLKASTVELVAGCSWPVLEIIRADIHFNDGSTATLNGKLDLETKSAADGRFHFDGPLARQWLPAEYSYGKLLVSGTFQGPLNKLAHEGRLEADDVTSPFLKPLALSARWNGEAETVQDFSIRLSSTNSSLALEGALATGKAPTELRLKTLSLSTNRSPALDLAEPVTISLLPPKPGTNWVLDTTRIRWAGPAGEVNVQASVEWPSRGVVQISAHRFPLEPAGGFFKVSPPKINVDRLEASAGWTNGPVTLGLELSANGLVGPPQTENAPSNKQSLMPAAAPHAGQDALLSGPAAPLLTTPLKIELSLRGDSRGILLSNLAINSPTSAVVVARGSLPLTFSPATPTNWVNLDAHQSLMLQASVRPEAFFWEELAKLSGVRLEDPDVDITFSGTWGAPQGRLTFQARRIQVNQAKLKQLNLEDLRLALTVDREMARLTQAQLLVQGQRLTASGELPLGEAAWKALEQRKPPDLARAAAQLRIQQAKLAAFEPFFPELLAPQGELDLDLRLTPGERLEGAMNVRDARTQPLGNIAPLRDIKLTLRLQDRLLILENASASLSGAPIDLAGRVDLRGTNWLESGLPPFALTLRGTNVPLAREPEYVIRSDLDLRIAKTNNAAPIVFGAAHLRDSFYLSDLAALVSGGVAKPSSRPPYFSIDDPLLADWRLGVTVDGVRWLKVRTSLFDGEVSANLHLQGTLKDPMVLGGLKIDSGVVRFPFANLQVQQGLVTLGSQDPYHPQLLVRGNSKQFGYDIRMEVSGAADDPVIQFTSNPSLSSEQILLMLTAGQLPRGSYTLSPQQRAETMALFLGRDLLSKIGLADQTQQRLIIRSGEEISDQGRPTYHIEYRFAKRWFIEGEYDRFGDYNAGFKWRVYSK